MTVFCWSWSAADHPTAADSRAQAQRSLADGNFQNALELFRKLVLQADTDPKLVGKDLLDAVQCLQQLEKMAEFDELVVGSTAAHAQNWRLLQAAAEAYRSIDHSGFMIAGKFERGPHRGNGKFQDATERDRVQGLQFLIQALPLVALEDDKTAVAPVYLSLAEKLQMHREPGAAWRLQALTDLSQLPDYEEPFFGWQEAPGAAVDSDGKPVFHLAPRSWEVAETDGQRWRWALDQAVENDPARRAEVRWTLAQFLQSQFDVTTIAAFSSRHPFLATNDDDQDQAARNGIYDLPSLTDSETIARLADGIRRFSLPDEFNFLKIYQELAAEKNAFQLPALRALADAFENRRQYSRAADLWKQLIEIQGLQDQLANSSERAIQPDDPLEIQRYRQIVGNWGQFEPIMTQPAGKGATVDFRFRNAQKVHFTAQPVKVDRLIADLKTYLKSNPKELDWEKVQLENLGWRIIDAGQAQYLSEPSAKWDLELEPRANHFDRRITVATPLQKPGAYLLTATLPSGNSSRIVIWIADTAIVSKKLSDRNLYFVADAVEGTPIERANLEFFGYQQESYGQNQRRINTHAFAELTNKDGLAHPDPRDLKADFQWLVIARGPGGRLAFQGFQNVWYQRYEDPEYNTIKVFMITDRPVYRPKHTTHFKFWVRQAQYDADDRPQFNKLEVPVEIRNPQGDKVLEQTLVTDEFGGAEASWEIPADAQLGVYQLIANPTRKNQLLATGGGSFRVEEYKKPEYEVQIESPKEPVMLGEKIIAQIQAKYLFGAPVTQGTVKYKVTRVTHAADWYPLAPWDWWTAPWIKIGPCEGSSPDNKRCALPSA